jgi:hypothetical protein
MEKALPEQLQDVIDALLVAESKAQLVARTIREQHLYLGLGLNHPDAEIARLVSTVRYTKLIAENKARGARGATASEPAPSTAQDVDGRIVSVSDTGTALVVNPVQDATALPDVSSETVEGLMAVGDEPAAETVPKPVVIPPTILQSPALDDASATQQDTPDEANGLPPSAHPDADGT